MARVPLYKAAETEMIRRIREGEWQVGQRLPNEFGLADEFGVSQGTMRRALITLEGMGLLARKPGRGTIVAATEPVTDTQDALPGAERLFDPTRLPLSLSVFRARSGSRAASDTEAALFQAERFHTLERTLKRGSTRFALDEVAVPAESGVTLDEGAAADFPALLLEAGLTAATIDDNVSAAITSMSDSVALSVDRHTPLLVVRRIARGANGTPIAQQVLRLVSSDIAYAVQVAV